MMILFYDKNKMLQKHCRVSKPKIDSDSKIYLFYFYIPLILFYVSLNLDWACSEDRGDENKDK